MTGNNDPELANPHAALERAAERADHVLDPAAYRQACALFERCLRDAACEQAVRDLAPEYGEPEFLLCVDRGGAAAGVDGESVRDFRRRSADHPGFAEWFQEGALPDGGPVLLVARWLCHLAGLRHATIHLFIDHPTLDDHTLVQVRGVDRAVSPGCFDLPVAGHVAGLDTVEETWVRELGEELGLGPADLEGVVGLGSVEHHVRAGPGLLDVERAAVYRGRLTPGGWARVSAGSGEVAGVALFTLADLRAMVARFPERVAGGLVASLAPYREVT